MTNMEVFPLFGCMCNAISISHIHPLMNWERCQHMYGWLELMVHHTPSKAEDKIAPFFIHPPMVHPLRIVWQIWMSSHRLVACATLYQPHIYIWWWIEWDANTCMDGWISWYIAHSSRQEQDVRQFPYIQAGPSSECCVSNMDSIPVFYCLCNGVLTSYMHLLMDWERSQPLHWWLELMVNHTPFKVEVESAPGSIHPPMVHPVNVVWTILMWSSCLVTCAMVYQSHLYIHWWIERGSNTCMDGWSSWYITHHPR